MIDERRLRELEKKFGMLEEIVLKLAEIILMEPDKSKEDRNYQTDERLRQINKQADMNS